MKLWKICFYLPWVFSCYCAHIDPTTYDKSYEEILNQDKNALGEVFSEESPYSGQYPMSDDEDSFMFEDWYGATVSLDADVEVDENSTEISEAIGRLSEMPILEEDWYMDGMESKLKMEYTPYSALLYQEDEFGLEFLCSGYWLKKDTLLIRSDCWSNKDGLNIEDTVAEVYLKNDLNLMVLRLHPNLSGTEEQQELHLANIRDDFPVSINDCALYVLRDDYALFEMYSWTIRPLPFKQAKALCRENHICLRTRATAAYGLDYALICDESLAGMLTTDRTKYERVFGKLTLMDLSIAKPWIDQFLNDEINGENVIQDLSLSLTPMPPAEIDIQAVEVI
uniref:Peptidase S1 domain-containing protein n=1 Tax=Anopheles funestus TaxID=62324 RepID=A0A182RI58_ANOFN